MQEVKLLGFQRALNTAQSVRAFRVCLAGIMSDTGTVRDQQGGHERAPGNFIFYFYISFGDNTGLDARITPSEDTKSRRTLPMLRPGGCVWQLTF